MKKVLTIIGLSVLITSCAINSTEPEKDQTLYLEETEPDLTSPRI